MAKAPMISPAAQQIYSEALSTDNLDPVMGSLWDSIVNAVSPSGIAASIESQPATQKEMAAHAAASGAGAAGAGAAGMAAGASDTPAWQGPPPQLAPNYYSSTVTAPKPAAPAAAAAAAAPASGGFADILSDLMSSASSAAAPAAAPAKAAPAAMVPAAAPKDRKPKQSESFFSREIPGIHLPVWQAMLGTVGVGAILAGIFLKSGKRRK